jgi:hypothetical protein
MTDSIDRTDRTPLDDQLDKVLATFATVQPRAGLEQRILANLRTHEPVSTRTVWWRWAGALAIVFVITILAVWRIGIHHSEQVVRHPANPLQRSQPQSANKDASGRHQQFPVSIAVRRPRKRASPGVAEAVGKAGTKPKLDQFPSPQPLSQEELVLARYAVEFPAEATLIAKAQDEYEREVQREMTSTDARTRPAGLDKQER